MRFNFFNTIRADVKNRFDLPDLGLGVGLRSCHNAYILEHQPDVDWFELTPENFLGFGGRARYMRDWICERYPVALHGVSLSIGSTDPLNWDYLKGLKQLADETKAVWMGDHVCWTGVQNLESHDLLPMPYSDESLEHLCERIRVVQDFLERPLILENPSTYLQFKSSTYSEASFLKVLCEQSGCGLLLDVNNIYVSGRNQGFDAWKYLDEIPYESVVQIHLAGHTDKGTHCIDTHSAPVIDEVWRLYAEVMQRAGRRATLLEWDTDIPNFERVHEEVLKARAFQPQAQELSSKGEASS